MKPNPLRVIYTLPDGQQVAALLRTDLFRELTSTPNVRWLLLSHLADQPAFRRQFDHPHVEVHRLPRLVPPFVDRQIEFLRREFIHHRLDPETGRILHQRARAVEPKRYWVHRPLAWLLSWLPGNDPFLAWLQDWLTRSREVELALEALQPDAVVLGSGAVKFPDVAVARFARLRRLPLFGIIHSWDNLAIKGPTVKCDQIAVWNRHMVQHALQLFRYRPEQVAVTGPCQFDVYGRGEPRISRSEFLARIGFTQERRLLSYTTMPPMSTNFSAHFVHQIAEWIGRDELAIPCQLLVRLHPQDNPELYADCQRLPHVHIEAPGRFRAPTHWRQAIYYYDPTDADVQHLRDTLWFSDVVLNLGSTITLEAIALDRPVVNLAYNPPSSSWPVSIGDYYRLTHYRPVTESGAVRLATSADDLKAALNEALLHPERRREARRALYADMVTYTDGGCAVRLACAILRFLGQVEKQQAASRAA
jgi:hypothetical protein